jgi:hypothetical protein
MLFWITIIVVGLVVGLGVEMLAGHIVGSILKNMDGPLQ